VTWHAGSAVLAYDAQITAAGITTVFDCFRIGSDEMDTRLGFGETYLPLADAVASAAEAGLLRAEHRTHARCEVAAPNVVAVLEAFLASRPAHLISLMDHTPGQRQFRYFEKCGVSGRPRAELEEAARERQRFAAPRALKNRPLIVAIARAHGIALASHDDTTIDEVEQAHADGVTIANFQRRSRRRSPRAPQVWPL